MILMVDRENKVLPKLIEVEVSHLELQDQRFILVVDDEVRQPQMRSLAHSLARIGEIDVVCAERPSDGMDVLDECIPLAMVLDLWFEGSETSGSEMLDELAENYSTMNTRIYPLTQNPELRVNPLVGVAWSLERETTKTADPGHFARRVLAPSFLDRRSAVEILVAGVDRGTETLELLAPTWSMDKTFKVSVDDEAFDVEHADLWRRLSRGGRLRTLVLRGRIALDATTPDSLYPWIYGISGELSPSTSIMAYAHEDLQYTYDLLDGLAFDD